ncbi:hypothetical protein T11_6318 [Trichinella zimbabwensis]|uniref:Uncharacterized protein n=1 Tax=Trichinella zimbabwensis TaxID=268475 RepID=A0A0V1DNY0_9BILA|nr:hypothetical protein T11_6318 [Trichinella zimbabwensis]
MKVNCTIFEFFFFNYWLAICIQQRTSLDFQSRSSIKKLQPLCL